MLKIRLQKVGRKNDAYYRVVVSPQGSAPRGGKFLEIVGNYSPRVKTLALKKERILYWISKGAQCSDTVHNLLVKEGIVSAPKRKIAMPKPIIKAGEKVEEKAEKIEEPVVAPAAEKSVEEVK